MRRKWARKKAQRKTTFRYLGGKGVDVREELKAIVEKQIIRSEGTKLAFLR